MSAAPFSFALDMESTESIAVDDAPETEVAPVEEPLVDEPDTDIDAEPAAEANPLIEEAARYGFSPEQAEALGDNLEYIMAQMDRQATSLGAPPAPAEPQRVEEKPAEKPAPPAGFESLDKLELKLKPEDYDGHEELVGDMRSVADHTNKHAERINQLTEVVRELATLALNNENKVKEIESTKHADEATTFAREADTFFAGLDNEFKAIYGAAPMAHLANGSPQVGSRNDLVKQAVMIRENHARLGRAPGSTGDYLRAAIRVLHPEKIKQVARREVKQEQETKRRQAIAAPSGKSSKPADSDARALRTIAKHLNSMGLNPNY